LSRTSKCRPSAGNSLNPADPGTTAASPDEGLLVQLNSLCEQRLDARYRRKLEAVTLLWQRHEKCLIEERAQASLRTVQRWADSVRRLGPEALHGRRRAPASKLNAEQRERLAADLKVGPSAFGYAHGGWSAALLMRHLRQSYGVRFSCAIAGVCSAHSAWPKPARCKDQRASGWTAKSPMRIGGRRFWHRR
jgi:transposase